MDTDAARTARRKAIKADLAEVYTDDEASPPEWVDLLSTTREAAQKIREDVERETTRFVDEPDIRAALDRRERFAAAARNRIGEINEKIKRMNLLAPSARFMRGVLDAEAVLKPLFRATRRRV